MGLNWFEKQGVKLSWRKAMKNGSIRRWVPLIAVAYIAVITIAQAFGMTGFADQLRAVGGLIDIESHSPVASSELVAAAAAVGGVVLKVLRTWGLIAAAEKAARSAPGPLMILFMLAGTASAQPVDPAPKALPSFSCAVHSGALRYVARGKDEDNLTTRLTCTLRAPAQLTLFGRGDITRTQDGGDLSDPKNFRSVEVMGGIRRAFSSGWELGVLGGTTYSIDGVFEPRDPRLWTLAAFARLRIMKGDGYILLGGGHHGPVGGPAAIASAVIPRGDKAAFFVDVAVPLSRAGLELNPYTLKAGAALCVKWC